MVKKAPLHSVQELSHWAPVTGLLIFTEKYKDGTNTGSTNEKSATQAKNACRSIFNKNMYRGPDFPKGTPLPEPVRSRPGGTEGF